MAFKKLMLHLRIKTTSFTELIAVFKMVVLVMQQMFPEVEQKKQRDLKLKEAYERVGLGMKEVAL